MSGSRSATRRTALRPWLVAVAIGLAACTASGAPGLAPPSPSPGQPLVDAPATDLISFATESRGQVALIRPDGTGRRVVVADHGWPVALAPDGRTLMVSSRPAPDREGVAFVAADGAARRDLGSGDGSNLVPGVWSPSGSAVAVARWGPEAGGGGVYVVEPGGSAGRLVSRPTGTDYDFPVAWSPDGRWIAFMRVPPVDDGNAFVGELYVVPADGSAVPWRVSPTGTAVRHFYIGPASFFPDSNRIAFVAAWGASGPRDPQGMVGRVMVADLAARRLESVTEPTAWTLTTRVSPDGQWLVYDRAPDGGSGSHRTFVVRPDGSDDRLLAGSPVGSVSAIWSPDGTYVLTAVDGPRGNNLVVVPVEGAGSPVELTRSAGETYLFYDWVRTG